MQWRGSVVQSEESGSLRSSHQTIEADRNSFSLSAPKMGYLLIFGFLRFRPKINFHFCFIFRFHSKNVICIGPKMLSSQLNRNYKFCDRHGGDFRFRFSAEKGISFSSAFSFTAENETYKMHFRSASTSNCFGLHPTSMFFKHSTIPASS